jgi:hypothetical protein
MDLKIGYGLDPEMPVGVYKLSGAVDGAYLRQNDVRERCAGEPHPWFAADRT